MASRRLTTVAGGLARRRGGEEGRASSAARPPRPATPAPRWTRTGGAPPPWRACAREAHGLFGIRLAVGRARAEAARIPRWGVCAADGYEREKKKRKTIAAVHYAANPAGPGTTSHTANTKRTPVGFTHTAPGHGPLRGRAAGHAPPSLASEKRPPTAKQGGRSRAQRRGRQSAGGRVAESLLRHAAHPPAGAITSCTCSRPFCRRTSSSSTGSSTGSSSSSRRDGSTRTCSRSRTWWRSGRTAHTPLNSVCRHRRRREERGGGGKRACAETQGTVGLRERRRWHSRHWGRRCAAHEPGAQKSESG